MDWSNERYVRVYTRDTVTWSLLPWQSQAVFLAVMRKVDRAGVLDVGEHEPVDAVAAITRWPRDVVAEGLPTLLQRGIIERSDAALVIPNFMEAQEATASDAQRARESRARRRDRARAGASQNVTAASRDATEPSHVVTRGHSVPSRAVPTLAEPRRAVPDGGGGTAPGADETGAPGPSPDEPTPAGSEPSPVPAGRTGPPGRTKVRASRPLGTDDDGTTAWRAVLTDLVWSTPNGARTIAVHDAAGRHLEPLLRGGLTADHVLKTCALYGHAVDQGHDDPKWWGPSMFKPERWEVIERIAHEQEQRNQQEAARRERDEAEREEEQRPSIEPARVDALASDFLGKLRTQPKEPTT